MIKEEASRLKPSGPIPTNNVKVAPEKQEDNDGEIADIERLASDRAYDSNKVAR